MLIRKFNSLKYKKGEYTYIFGSYNQQQEGPNKIHKSYFRIAWIYYN
jgi:hypothetical protein